MLEFFDHLEPAGPSDLTKAMKSFTMRAKGKGVVILVSDFMDKAGYEDALRYLIARQLDVYIIHVLAPEEVKPEVVGDLKLVDVEDGDTAEITVSRPLLERYQKNLDAFRGGLYDFCTRRGVSCIQTTSDVPFEGLVLNYLRRRGLVR